MRAGEPAPRAAVANSKRPRPNTSEAEQSLGEHPSRPRRGAKPPWPRWRPLLASLGRQSEQLEAQRQIHVRATTEVKIELAKSEEQLRNLQARRRQFEESQQERQRAIAENREQLAQCRRRARQSRWTMLEAESEIAELYLRKEAFARETVALIRQRDELGAERTELTGGAQRIRSRIRKLEEKIHAQELAAGEIRHERNALADRLREDYQIELAELGASTRPRRNSTAARRSSRKSTSCGRRSTTWATSTSRPSRNSRNSTPGTRTSRASTRT